MRQLHDLCINIIHLLRVSLQHITLFIYLHEFCVQVILQDTRSIKLFIQQYTFNYTMSTSIAENLGRAESTIHSLLSPKNYTAQDARTALRLRSLLLELDMWKKEVTYGDTAQTSMFAALHRENPVAANTICFFLGDVFLAARALGHCQRDYRYVSACIPLLFVIVILTVRSQIGQGVETALAMLESSVARLTQHVRNF